MKDNLPTGSAIITIAEHDRLRQRDKELTELLKRNVVSVQVNYGRYYKRNLEIDLEISLADDPELEVVLKEIYSKVLSDVDATNGKYASLVSSECDLLSRLKYFRNLGFFARIKKAIKNNI